MTFLLHSNSDMFQMGSTVGRDHTVHATRCLTQLSYHKILVIHHCNRRLL